MLINIRAFCELLPDSLAEQLNILEYPAVLIDNDLKVLAKNPEANGFAPFLRKGCKITRFLPEGDEAKIKGMITSDTLISSFNKDGAKIQINVICGFDCYLAVLHPDSGGLRTAVIAKYGNMSGYEADISEPQPSSMPKTGMAEIIESALRKQLTPHPLPFFDSSAIIKCLLNEIERILPKHRSRIKFSCPSDELISEGDEKDFLLVIAFMISLCLDLSEKDVCVEVENDKNELVFRVFANADESEYEVARLVSLSKGYGSTSDNFNESDFRAYMLKLLSDGNLWDFSIGHNGNKVDFTLRTPYVKSGEEFTVRDVSVAFVAKVIKELFTE